MRIFGRYSLHNSALNIAPTHCSSVNAVQNSCTNANHLSLLTRSISYYITLTQRLWTPRSTGFNKRVGSSWGHTHTLDQLRRTHTHTPLQHSILLRIYLIHTYNSSQLTHYERLLFDQAENGNIIRDLSMTTDNIFCNFRRVANRKRKGPSFDGRNRTDG
jgi:hypothetical protein